MAVTIPKLDIVTAFLFYILPVLLYLWIYSSKAFSTVAVLESFVSAINFSSSSDTAMSILQFKFLYFFLGIVSPLSFFIILKARIETFCLLCDFYNRLLNLFAMLPDSHSMWGNHK